MPVLGVKIDEHDVVAVHRSPQHSGDMVEAIYEVVRCRDEVR